MRTAGDALTGDVGIVGGLTKCVCGLFVGGIM